MTWAPPGFPPPYEPSASGYQIAMVVKATEMVGRLDTLISEMQHLRRDLREQMGTLSRSRSKTATGRTAMQRWTLLLQAGLPYVALARRGLIAFTLWLLLGTGAYNVNDIGKALAEMLRHL